MITLQKFGSLIRAATPPIRISFSDVFGEEIMPDTPPVSAWGYRWLTRLPYCTVARRLTAMPMNITSFRFVCLIVVIAKSSTGSIPLPCHRAIVINTTSIKKKIKYAGKEYCWLDHFLGFQSRVNSSHNALFSGNLYENVSCIRRYAAGYV